MELNKQVMIDSYRNISFYGERRGEQEFKYYTELLAADIERLKNSDKVENYDSLNYESKFIDKVMTYFHRQANCASAFICGPANFNIRSNQKKWDSRDKALSDFEHWRSKYLYNAIDKVKTLSPEAELDKAIERLEYLETEKAKPKKYSHTYLSDKENYPDDACRVYSVTTKIRECKKKIQIMKNRIEAKANFKPVYFKGGVITLENDRIIVKHEDKPEREIIDGIKKHGFRWSPKFKSWCRKHTGNAIYSTNLLLKDVLGGAIC